MDFEVIWLTVALIAFVASIVIAAWSKEPDAGDAIMTMGFIAIMWPVLLGIAAIVAPFWAIYAGVSWLRERHDAKRR